MRRKKGDPRSWLIAIAEEIRALRLSDSTGGNVSMRWGDLIYMTPRYAGSRNRWHLRPKDIVVFDMQTRTFFSHQRKPSREAGMHLAIYENFPEVGAVIHAHPYYTMVFACARVPLEPTAEYTLKLGTIPLTQEAPAHSRRLAEAVVAELKNVREEQRTNGAAVLIPAHGVVCVGENLDHAFTVLERVETNARISLYMRSVGGFG